VFELQAFQNPSGIDMRAINRQSHY